MTSGRFPKSSDPLDAMIRAADIAVLGDLVRRLASSDVSIRRRCVELLKDVVSLADDEKEAAEAEAALVLWNELECDLAEMNQYGGAGDDAVSRVGGLLYDLTKKLKERMTPREARQSLLDRILPYIRSGNAGMDDALYDAAYAACYDDADWRDLAARLETIGKDWPLDHARRIYRKLADSGKYLELRMRKMEYGADFHDLATFYWEAGEREKALAVGRKGLANARGRMTELREFMARQANRSGDRAGFVELEFQEAVDRLTLDGYRKFRKLCSADEWALYEPKLLTRLSETWPAEIIKIRIFRGENDKAAERLARERLGPYVGSEMLAAAKKLEKSHPERVLTFYLTGLVRMERPAPRKEYVEMAGVLVLIRRVMLDALADPERWRRFRNELRQKTANRPAFQEEAMKRITDWME